MVSAVATSSQVFAPKQAAPASAMDTMAAREAANILSDHWWTGGPGGGRVRRAAGGRRDAGGFLAVRLRRQPLAGLEQHPGRGGGGRGRAGMRDRRRMDRLPAGRADRGQRRRGGSGPAPGGSGSRDRVAAGGGTGRLLLPQPSGERAKPGAAGGVRRLGATAAEDTVRGSGFAPGWLGMGGEGNLERRRRGRVRAGHGGGT